jgi:RimJ/RimL family protein N-acetyltransferase
MISLRPVSTDDFNLIFEWENIPELWKVSEQQGPFSREEIESFISNCLDVNNTEIERWIVCNSSVPIGAIDIFEYDLLNQNCGIGIFISNYTNRNKGYAGAALAQAVSMLQARGCLLIRAIIYTDNTSSRRLFLSAGFQEGATTPYKGKSALHFFWTPRA